MSDLLAPRKGGRLQLGSRLLALATLFVLTPLGVVIALAIVIDSGSPVFFSQARLGVHGRRFQMLKFRKFHTSVGRDTAPLTLAEDPRYTRIGRLLGKAKLDELPQLWNVVRGEMAIVGPRPEVPDFESCFAGSFGRLLDYRPGIFGPSQAAFSGEAALYPRDQRPEDFYREVLFPTKAAIDLVYYPQRTIFGDVGWVLRGIGAVCGLYPQANVSSMGLRAPESQTIERGKATV
jgi:lipopolysaccharide/colanic/teichoic acid biosynthesis glycosyltransferase